MACGEKQRRLTELHWAWVGGVSDDVTCTKSDTSGCGNGSADDGRVAARAAEPTTSGTSSVARATPRTRYPGRWRARHRASSKPVAVRLGVSGRGTLA